MFNLDDYLKEMEATEEKTAETKIESEVKEPVKAEAEETKVASIVEEGQVFARAFNDELTKLAVGEAQMPTDTASVKTPADANKIPTTEIKAEEANKVQAILNSLYAPTKAGGGEISTPAGTVAKVPSVLDESPIPADAVKAQEQAAGAEIVEQRKAAAATILTNLYTQVFGEDK